MRRIRIPNNRWDALSNCMRTSRGICECNFINPFNRTYNVKFLAEQAKDQLCRIFAVHSWNTWFGACLLCQRFLSTNCPDRWSDAESRSAITTSLPDIRVSLRWLSAHAAEHKMYDTMRTLLGSRGQLCICNGDQLPQMHMQLSELDMSRTPESLPSQQTTRLYLHGHTWPIAKDNLGKPIRSGHNVSLLQASTSIANFEEQVQRMLHPSSRTIRPPYTG